MVFDKFILTMPLRIRQPGQTRRQVEWRGGLRCVIARRQEIIGNYSRSF